MKRSKPPWWGLSLWGFAVFWEDSGWHLLWLVNTAFAALMAPAVIVLVGTGEPSSAYRVACLMAGTSALAYLCASLHRRCNRGETVLGYFMRGKKRGRP